MFASPEIHIERCVRYRYRYSGCQRCADACPHDAVRLHDAGIEIAADRCQGCALCAAACMTEAVAAKYVTDKLPPNNTAQKRQVQIACAPSGIAAENVVPCLGAVDVLLLATLLREGVEVYLAGSGHCALCAHAPQGAAWLDLQLDALAMLRAAVGNSKWATLVRVGDAPQAAQLAPPQAARRQWLRHLLVCGLQHGRTRDAARSVPPAYAIRAAAVFVPARRQQLGQLLHDAKHETQVLPRHAAVAAGSVAVAPTCTYCEACVRVCPTAALQLLENSKQWQLGFRTERCVACGVCVEACQPGALQLRDRFDGNSRESVVLRQLGKQLCTQCSRSFASEEGIEICPVCLADNEDFASIFG